SGRGRAASKTRRRTSVESGGATSARTRQATKSALQFSSRRVLSANSPTGCSPEKHWSRPTAPRPAGRPRSRPHASELILQPALHCHDAERSRPVRESPQHPPPARPGRGEQSCVRGSRSCATSGVRVDASIMPVMPLHPRFVCVLGLIGMLVILLAPVEASERFTATAAVKGGAGGAATAPLTIVVDKFSTAAERESLLKALKEGGTSGRDLLARRPAVGSLQIGTRSTPIKYAYAVSTGDRRLITVVTGLPIAFDDAGGRPPEPCPRLQHPPPPSHSRSSRP